MDDHSFDRLARLLGEATDRRAGLKTALAAVFGGSAAVAVLDAEAKRKSKGKDQDRNHRRDEDRDDAGPDADRRRKRRKKCTPACEGGFTCVKGQCTCASGVTCGAACCSGGQVCRDGDCVDPLPACLPFGAACKNAGRACCAGLSCASGQDGTYPVACYRSKGAACASTAECPFGMTCTNGVCLGTGGGGGGVPTGAPCSAGANCDQPGAVCTAYTGDDAPTGDFCTLPLRKVCSGDPDCTCYKCWYVNGGAQGTGRAGRSGRASLNTKACCHPPGEPCVTENDCCYNLTCNAGVCGGTMCVPEGGQSADGACCDGLSVQNGVCTSGGGPCSGANLAFGAECCTSNQCSTGLCWYPQDDDGNPDGTTKKCVVALNGSCDYDGMGYSQCGLGNECDDFVTDDVYICTDYDDPEDYGLKVPTGASGCTDTILCYEADDTPGAYCNAGTCTARTQLAIKDACDPTDDSKACPERASCQTYGDGVGTLAPNTTTTYCLGNYYYQPTTASDASECASYLLYDGRCTSNCSIYLTSGATDQARGAALKQALESFAASTDGTKLFFIEPDQATSNVRKYLVNAGEIAFTASKWVGVANCLGTGTIPNAVVSGGGQNRILNVTLAGTGYFTIQYVNLENGSATGDGGAALIDGSAQVPNQWNTNRSTFSSGTITGSTATGNGGGLATKGRFEVSGTTISGNTATSGSGGGWYAQTSPGQVVSPGFGLTITTNAAGTQGAGFFFDFSGTTSTGANGLSCSTSGVSISGNTDASAPKYDCAYGGALTQAPSFNWANCGCGTKEPTPA